MTKLSVNVNKIATIRNARGGNNPNLVQIVKDCEKFGAQGITVHPRPDQRHITTKDVYDLSKVVTTEFNIEGYPNERYLKMIEEVKPAQATLVPDTLDVITSNAGWDTIKYQGFLKRIVERIKQFGVRASIFIDPNADMVEAAAILGADRVELYTENYATAYSKNRNTAIAAYTASGRLAKKLDMGLNAGHDLDLKNLKFMKQSMPFIDEVSIGHALVCDALYLGLESTIMQYLNQLK